MSPPLAAATLAALALYGLALAAVRRRGGRWPLRRSAAYASGVAVVAAALSSPVDRVSDRLLSAHMAEHLALCLVAAPLLVAGRPESLALRALQGRARRRLATVLTSRATGVLAGPPAAWLAFVGVQWGTHLTGFFEYAEAHPLAHAGEHALYLASSALFWRCALDVSPARHRLSPLGRIAFLLLAMPASDLVGVWLMSSGSLRYPSYAEHAGVAAALADQRLAGMLMIAGSVVLALAAFAIGRRWFFEDERRQALRERLEGHGA